MRPGIHYPDKFDVATLTHSISNLKVDDSCESKPECNTLLSMTGVSILYLNYTILCKRIY